MASPFRSHRAAVVRANRWLLGASTLLAVLALLALLLKGPAALLAVLVGLLAFGGLKASRERRFPELVPTLIEADEAGVRDRGKLLVRRDQLTQGFAFALGDGCLVRLMRRGRRQPVDIVTWDENDGRALLRALGLDASQTSAELRGLPFTGYLPRRGPALLVAIPSFLIAGLLGPFLPAFFLSMVLLIAVPASIGTRISIGVDGIHVRWLRWSRFYSFSRVAAIRAYESDQRYGFELELSSGERRPILISKGRDAEMAKLALDRVQQAWQAYSEGGPGADVSAALARRDRSPREWLEGLRTVGAGANADMRTAAVSPERLWQIVEDPSAAPLDRVSAAVALASRGDEQHQRRVGDAARRIASPKLRVALEKTAGPDATDAELAELLAELEGERATAEKRARR